MGYDAGKAAMFNQLRQSGVSEDAALAQAGITEADIGNYAIGMNGQMGALVIGTGTKPGVEVVKSVDYDLEAKDPVSSKTPMNYNTTSTETVSGGGSTTVVTGQRIPNSTSQALGNAYAAKNAEYNQFVKDNPSDFARKRQGLPPMTAEEKAAYTEKLNTLNKEKETLKNQQIDAETPGAPSVTTTPNTTTTTTTTQAYKSPTNAAVNIQNDQATFQQAETQLDNQTPVVANTATASSAAPVDAGEDPYVSNGQSTITPVDQGAGEDPFEAERLRRAQEFDAPAPTLTAEDVGPMDAGVEAQLEFEQEQNRELLKAENYQPEPVNLDDDPAVKALMEESRAASEAQYNEMSDPESDYSAQTKKLLADAQAQATRAQRYNQTTKGDWRVRLRLGVGAQYLYQDESNALLKPLRDSDGVVFPYTPIINTSYAAKYDPYDLVHSNYRGYFYRGSSVSELQLQATFTAQDTAEARYVLAVIHFFRSATKMFYGKDYERGTPPPLVYLSGYGEYQFNDHACVISNFQYNLPADVDYIGVAPNNMGLNMSNRLGQVGASPTSTISSAINRLANLFNAATGNPGVPKGAVTGRTDLGIVRQTVNGTGQTTYVPTKIDMSITLLPIQTRAQVSKEFSLKGFANGDLLKKGFW